MVTKKEAINKLKEYAEKFEAHYHNKEYGKAKNIYNMALISATFVELGEDEMKMFFGDTAAEPKEIGLFKFEMVQKVDEICCVRGNMGFQQQSCMKLGIPWMGYTEEDYCARGCKKRRHF